MLHTWGRQYRQVQQLSSVYLFSQCPGAQRWNAFGRLIQIPWGIPIQELTCWYAVRMIDMMSWALHISMIDIKVPRISQDPLRSWLRKFYMRWQQLVAYHIIRHHGWWNCVRLPWFLELVTNQLASKQTLFACLTDEHMKIMAGMTSTRLSFSHCLQWTRWLLSLSLKHALQSTSCSGSIHADAVVQCSWTP